ncbi:DUF4376 domain-containing protein [Escherichia coli]|nr:DUF4376 domain-containing protein [Escherichia coli]EES4298292.1 DUF4376 domain-containing protein [Escherichia coli]EES8720214.1 DUF4376 domain-containing protein [Escherichia coli]EES9590652.1 DUF4376 domain-containing protein [Escherichia coli]EET7852704.1 DUF4376 domain-containing protein [Escherichia coli]
MNLKNLQRYTPEKSDVPGAMYLKTEDGRDWYESQSSFKADTLKLVYDSEGIITSISKDVSMLWPVGQSVVEVEDTEENRKADISGRWKFDGEKVVDTLTAEKARGMKGDEINAWRNAMEAANYTFEHNGRKWDYGKSTQTRLEPSVAAAKAGKLPEAFFWTDAENNDVQVTAEELLALSEAAEQAMFTKGMEIHIRQRTMKKDLELLSSADEILAYRVGWAQE